MWTLPEMSLCSSALTEGIALAVGLLTTVLLPVQFVTRHGTFIITVFLDPDKNKYFDGVPVL